MISTLDNGLRVVLLTDPSATAVALQLWITAGSGDEADRESGLAHLHEHMLFKGTARRGVGEIARAVEGAGGDVNAWTSYDETVYHLVLPGRELALGLDVLADAAQASLFDADELAREIEVVLEEIRRSADSPVRQAQDALFADLYGAHPYRRPILGPAETVAGFRRDDVLAFYGKHYAPSRAVLVVSGGGFDPAAVEAQIADSFGGWATPGVTREPLPAYQLPGLPTSRVIGRPCSEAHVHLALPAPDAGDPAAVDADLLAVLLGQGESSRLARGVKRGRGLANDVFGYAFTPRGPGLQVYGATCPPDRIQDTATALGAELGRLAAQGVSAGELARARQMIESDLLFQHETVQGRARKAGYYVTLFDDPGWEAEYLARLAAVTPARLSAAAAELLDRDRTALVVVAPEEVAAGLDGTEVLGRVVDRTAAGTAAGPREAGDAGALIRHDLAGGGTLLVRVDRRVPLAAVRAVLPGGLRAETRETNGRYNLLARLLTRGTSTRSGDALAESIEALGGAIGGFSGRNSLGLRGEFLAESFSDGLALLADDLRDPAFPRPEVAREQERTLEAIRHREDEPGRRVFRLFESTHYQVHPFGLDALGTAETVGGVTAEQLRAAYFETCLTWPLTVAVVGNVDPDAVLAQAERLLAGPAETSAQPLPAPPAEPAREGRREARQHLDRQQSHLVIGYPGAHFADPDRYALDVLAAVLGGQGGRLFLDLRDRQSLAYAVAAFSLEAFDPGYFALYIACAPDKVDVALTGLGEHVDRLVQDPVPAEELAAVQRYLAGSHEIERQRTSARAAQLAFDVAYGLGPENSEEYGERILAVTADEVLAVARRRLQPELATQVVLGPDA